MKSGLHFSDGKSLWFRLAAVWHRREAEPQTFSSQKSANRWMKDAQITQRNVISTWPKVSHDFIFPQTVGNQPCPLLCAFVWDMRRQNPERLPAGYLQLQPSSASIFNSQFCVQDKNDDRGKKPGFFLQSGSRLVWEKAGFLARFRFFVLYTVLNFITPSKDSSDPSTLNEASGWAHSP